MSVFGFNNTAWVDGACQRDGSGGWAVVFMDGRQISGHEPDALSERMELRAVVEAACLIPLSKQLIVWSDNQGIVRQCRSGFAGKRRNNKDLWLRFDQAIREGRHIKVKWLPALSEPEHRRADELAKMAAVGKTTNGLRRSTGGQRP